MHALPKTKSVYGQFQVTYDDMLAFVPARVYSVRMRMSALAENLSVTTRHGDIYILLLAESSVHKYKYE